MIEPSETEIVGEWVVQGGRVLGDAACSRIDRLVQGYLTRLGHDDSGWETLYQDPSDKRLWVLSYPRSWMHGGGPPTLRQISPGDAKEKFAISVS